MNEVPTRNVSFSADELPPPPPPPMGSVDEDKLAYGRTLSRTLSARIDEIEGGMLDSTVGIEMAPGSEHVPQSDSDYMSASSNANHGLNITEGIQNLDRVLGETGSEDRSQYSAAERRTLFLDAAGKL
mmetsp:Transcript_23271/g.48384  ORF Transcript_23271/g.48384 Transcript_23271/m.48384 type:complete len:128 (+) Transcript_23271:285-668(+)